ncbi:MAG: PilZ domain-containing protein, partial [Bdellovibrionales bacterium]
HNLQWWTRELPHLSSKFQSGPVSHEVWHYALHGKSHGPLTQEQLVSALRSLGSLGDVLLWTKGMKEWAPLFEFHDILSAVGVNKRQFPRAEVKGKALIKAGGATLVAPLTSISEGGFGIQLEAGLVPGELVTVEIQSPSFREPLQAKAECRYLNNGVVGMKFTKISLENKGAIVQFVRQNQTRFVLKAA